MADHNSAAVVLIVEDEPVQRMVLVEGIEEAGFVVLEAAGAEEAIAILESRTDVRVVFTDIDMPGDMDGLKLALAVRDRWPPIEIIVTTAGLPPGTDMLPMRSLFLPKPFAMSEALAAIDRMVA